MFVTTRTDRSAVVDNPGEGCIDACGPMDETAKPAGRRLGTPHRVELRRGVEQYHWKSAPGLGLRAGVFAPSVSRVPSCQVVRSVASHRARRRSESESVPPR